MLLKNKVLFLLVFLGGTFSSYADLSLEGHYQGKNLYVQNPEDEDGFGFCVTKATVNGDPIIDGLQSSAFEIDFTVFGLKIGDPVFIVLEHGIGCKPKVLNKEVLLPKSTFDIESISCTPDGALSWTTTGESGKLPFVVEQYRWNKWVAVGEVDGVGEAGTNAYTFNVTPHSGENKVRVTQTDNTGQKRPSESVTFENTTLDVIEVSPKMVKSSIKFTSNNKPVETKYEIYDAYGNIVKKGVGSEVDCSNLKKGAYYINFDNKNEKFIKK
ncbi:T9SS type A sorting domain-containing protein [Crocinitomix algicola]|uniref:T9SS type A sorting domain-containing protein n=1 Tax=Crocinitomix algicola TaxID=1740263 RepID=UPI00082C78D5|nr:T9SS type A sorting domain-containing protein [Crocinitomix algicola]